MNSSPSLKLTITAQFCIPIVLSFQEYHINGIDPYTVFWSWLLSLGQVYLRLIYVVEWSHSTFLNITHLLVYHWHTINSTYWSLDLTSFEIRMQPYNLHYNQHNRPVTTKTFLVPLCHHFSRPSLLPSLSIPWCVVTMDTFTFARILEG